MALERTLAIIKPDAVAGGHTGDILMAIEQNGLRVLSMKMRRLSQREAEVFYEIHKQRPFFPGLVRFMTEGAVLLLALEGENAVAKWREVMGATNPANAAEGTIRRQFAENIERNSVHGSDSLETAAQEVAFFFSAAELL
jgi:nucleoside-diphosphate kinase